MTLKRQIQETDPELFTRAAEGIFMRLHTNNPDTQSDLERRSKEYRPLHGAIDVIWDEAVKKGLSDREVNLVHLGVTLLASIIVEAAELEALPDLD